MAFLIKTGNQMNPGCSSASSLFQQAIRCMSSSKLFVGGIAYATDDQALREAFTGFGQVTEAKVILDRETGRRRSRGFGFVSFASEEQASKALSMHGT
ncbi:hypothetical protein MKW94_025970, partial [Papaver nudicaule]|nr:hypothetical protein [Papaver nudicaule]